MDFDLSDEQRLLKDSVERLLEDQYDFEARRKHGAGANGFSEDMWGRYAELGLLALPFAEEHGGIGGGTTETMIVMEAFGKSLILEPFLASIILSGSVLRHAANDAQKSELIPAMAEGRTKMAFAYAEQQGRYDLFDVETAAAKDGESWVITGSKGLVLHGDSADKIIVSARTAGDSRDTDGISLFLVDANANGVSRLGYATQDGLRAAEITLQGVKVGPEALIGEEGAGWPVISRVADEAIAALCAEAVGCFERMHELTLEYLKTRSQFGTTIGSFQALQHRAADMFVELEQSRSMTMYASMLANEDDAVERARAVSAAKVQIGESAKIIGPEAIQLHGGVGMTMEYAIGHYFKRTTMIDLLFGDAKHHLKRLAQLDGLIREDA